jgi:hypothetical protein
MESPCASISGKRKFFGGNKFFMPASAGRGATFVKSKDLNAEKSERKMSVAVMVTADVNWLMTSGI